MDYDNPEKRRQRLRDLRSQGERNRELEMQQPSNPLSSEGHPRPGRQQGSRRGRGRGGDGRLLERFPRLREAMEARTSDQGDKVAQDKPLLRKLMQRRRANEANERNGGQRRIKPLSELDEQQLQQRVDKLQAKLEEAQHELDTLKEGRAKDPASPSTD